MNVAYLLIFIYDTCCSKKWYLIIYSSWCFVCISNWNLSHGWPGCVCFNYASGALSKLIETVSKWFMNVNGLSSHCMQVLFNFTKKSRKNWKKYEAKYVNKPKWNWIKNILQDAYSARKDKIWQNIAIHIHTNHFHLFKHFQKLKFIEDV